MKLYVSGPMSGKPRFNFDAFEAATADLRKRGFEVISPAEMDVEAGIEPGDAETDQTEQPAQYADFLTRDIHVIAEDGVEGIAVLPGWHLSGGARTEVMFALALRLPIFTYPDLYRVAGIGVHWEVDALAKRAQDH